MSSEQSSPVRLSEAWVVFDGTEPDSKVMGLAATLEDVIAAIGSTVNIDRKTLAIELPYSDAGVVTASVTPLYGAGDHRAGEWAIRKERIYG